MSTQIYIQIETDDPDIQNDVTRIFSNHQSVERYLMGMLLGYRFEVNGPIQTTMITRRVKRSTYNLASIGPKGMVDYGGVVKVPATVSLELELAARKAQGCTCSREPYAPVCDLCSERLTSEVRSARKMEHARLSYDNSVNGVSGAPDKTEE